LNARQRLLALATAVALGGGVLLLLADAPPHERTPPTIIVADADDTFAGRRTMPDTSVPQPVPRVDAVALQHLPVRQQIEQLDARARAGDAVVACRLATELQRCLIERWRLGAAGGRPEQLAERKRLQAHCATVDGVGDRLRSLEYLLVAANRGNTAAMALFAGADLNAADLLRDPALYHLYRMNASRLLEQALAAGEPLALVIVSLNFPWPGMGVPMGPAAAIIPAAWNDAGLVRALQVRVQRELDGPDRAFVPPEPPLSEEDIARSDRIWEQTFANSSALAKLRRATERSSSVEDLSRFGEFDAQLLLQRCEEN
jgi:hypothetical protein